MRTLLFIAFTVCALGCGKQPGTEGEVPITYRVGWWGSQDDLTVTRLEVKIDDTPLNLMNNRTRASVAITTRLCEARSGWRPTIAALHVSQQPTGNRKPHEYAAEIRLTPVVELVEDSSYTPRSDAVVVRANLHLETLGWGENRFVFQSGGHVTETLLLQRK